MPRSSHPPQARQWFFLLCALSAALLLLRPAPAMEAVREALRAGKIQKSRYASYLRLYEELKPLRDWQEAKRAKGRSI